MTPADQQVDRVVATMAESRREPPSRTVRLIAANGKVAALDKAVIAHKSESAPMLRILEQLMRSGAIDQDCSVPADDGGPALTFDDFENALLTVAMSLSALDVKRRTAVES
ncbi:hypothetical protein ACXYTP_25345 [Tsukamurella ocularis]